MSWFASLAMFCCCSRAGTAKCVALGATICAGGFFTEVYSRNFVRSVDFPFFQRSTTVRYACFSLEALRLVRAGGEGMVGFVVFRPPGCCVFPFTGFWGIGKVFVGPDRTSVSFSPEHAPGTSRRILGDACLAASCLHFNPHPIFLDALDRCLKQVVVGRQL